MFNRFQTCNIPKLEINGTEVIHFFHKPPPLVCDKTGEKNWGYLDDDAKFALIPERLALFYGLAVSNN